MASAPPADAFPGRIAGLALAGLSAVPLLALRAFGACPVGSPLAAAEAPGFALCLFRTVSGVPCPFCGGTRATMALAGGAPGDAFLWNPLAVLIHAGLLVTGIALALGLRPPWLAPGRSPAALRVLLVLVAGNWAYLIVVGR